MGVTAKVSGAASKVSEGGKYYGGILATKASNAKQAVGQRLEESDRFQVVKQKASSGFGTVKGYASAGASSLYSRVWGKPAEE